MVDWAGVGLYLWCRHILCHGEVPKIPTNVLNIVLIPGQSIQHIYTHLDIHIDGHTPHPTVTVTL